MKMVLLRRLIALGLFVIAQTSSNFAFAENTMSFVTVSGHGGAALNVMETGNPAGPEILFVHGMGMSYLSFQPQYNSDLAKEFRIVALDLRGHGNSAKPWNEADVKPSEVWADDIAAVIAAKNLKKPVIVAWSFGGFVTADYVRKYGTSGIAGVNFVGTLAGLVKQEPPVGNMSPEEMKRRAAMQTSGNFEDFLTIVEQTTKMFEYPGITPEYRELMFNMGVMVPPYFRKAFSGANLDHQDVTPVLVDLPVLVSMGESDRGYADAGYGLLKKALPHAKFSEYAATGHLPFAHHPDRFNGELAAFVRDANR
ncbi:MAG: alpha/beta hydrolase [Rhodobacteraceae bacterium]|nr:alpha/beta hydrolase [Paracoccaceae bacterium]